MKTEIRNLWTTKLIVKDFDKPKEFNENLKEIYKDYIATHEIRKGSGILTGTEEPQVLNILLPEVIELRAMFEDAYKELVELYHPGIDLDYYIDENPRVSIMRNKDYRQTHVHARTAAFGIYYVDSGDAEDTKTGLLELNDPRNLFTVALCDANTNTVIPKTGRMVIAPSYVWHSVTPYYGNKERIAIVCEMLIPDCNPIENELRRNGRT